MAGFIDLLKFCSSLPQVRSAREDLQHRWNRACRKVGAPPLHIYSNVNDDEVPPLGANFVYIESGYYDSYVLLYCLV